MIIKSIQNKKLLEKANVFLKTGAVFQQGFYAFLKIEDRFIHDLWPEFQPKENIKKPDYFEEPDPVGAHISIVYPEENCFLDAIDVGMSHCFDIKELCSVVLGVKEYFVLMVSSPSLGTLRSKYSLGMQPIYKNFKIDFHITIGERFV